MKIHIGILTSSEPNKAARCLASALVQIGHPFEVSCSVMVNSLKGYYYSDVVNAVSKIEGAEKTPVLRSPSNGRPGNGKNEAFNWMRSNVDADYYMLLDGDDFLYPTALKVLEPLMIKGHQLITGLSQDMWENGNLAVSWNDDQPNNAVKFNRDITKIDDIDLWNSYSIDRIYAIKKDFLQWMPKMDSDLDLYEDFLFTVECAKLYESGKLDYVMVNNSHIYAYDASGDSQCSIFNTDRRLAQWNMDKFLDLCSKHLPIRFSKVPFTELDNPNGFSVFEKIEFYKLISKNETYIRAQ